MNNKEQIKISEAFFRSFTDEEDDPNDPIEFEDGDKELISLFEFIADVQTDFNIWKSILYRNLIVRRISDQKLFKLEYDSCPQIGRKDVDNYTLVETKEVKKLVTEYE